MNRCEVCDKTDEDDPKAGIVIHSDGAICLECYTIINQNLEDLRIHDETPIDYLDTFLLPAPVEDDHWITPAVSEVSEQ